jgi:hypothetical protein
MSVRNGMGTRTARWLAWGAALGLTLCAPSLLARPKPIAEPALGAEHVTAVPTQNINPPTRISLQQAIEIVQMRYPGRVVGAKTINENGREVHEIRVLGTENRVRTVRLDAQSGALL